MPQPLADDRHGGVVLKLHRKAKTVEFQTFPPDAETLAYPVNSRDWHGDCCNTNLTRAQGLGVAAHSPCSTAKGRGGARNHADRVSHTLSAGHVGNLTAATRHADTIGLPFTRMITIHWEAAGLPLKGMAKATARYTDLLTKTLARHGNATSWLWVHENGDGKGGHCHLLAHVPPDLVSALTGLQRGWLRRITGKSYVARVIRSKPIGGRLGLEASNPDLHAINLDAALSYILKGANAAAASQFGLERLEPGGRVIGKRCGTSQNIGAKARGTPADSTPRKNHTPRRHGEYHDRTE